MCGAISIEYFINETKLKLYVFAVIMIQNLYNIVQQIYLMKCNINKVMFN